MTARQYLKWGSALVIAAVISLVSIVGTLIWTALQPTPTVPLTAGLTGNWDAVSAEMDRRVKARFPIGSSEDALIAELRHQGFAKQDWRASMESEHEASRAENEFPCNKAAYVFWHADAAGVLTAIRGTYREEGCL